MKKTTRIVKKISWWHYLLIIIIGAFSFFTYSFSQRESFSANEATITLNGPGTFKTQEKVEFEITLRNNSRFALSNVAAHIVLPEFLAFEGYEGSEQKIAFEDVGPHGETQKNFSVFAKATERRGQLKARVEYTPGNLAGRFENSAEKEVFVSSLPMTVVADLPGKAVNGQKMRASIHFVAEKEIGELPLLVRMVLPDDFTLEDSAPALPRGETTWEFAEVVPGNDYEVEFEGIIRGREDEAEVFTLLFGIKDAATGFKEQLRLSREVRLESSPLTLTQIVNGVEEYVASAGERLRFEILYANKSGVEVEDVKITAQLSEEAFAFNTLDALGGYFSKGTKTIIWNKDFMGRLARLAPDEESKVEFIISLQDKILPKDLVGSDKSIQVKALIDSASTPLALKGLSLRSEHILTIRLRTSAEISGAAYYYQGPFSNSGPVPPRVGEATTYTILWRAANTLNELNDAKVEAALPEGVTFNEKIYPAGSNIKYDAQERKIVWKIGALAPGVGFSLPEETVAFQVSFIPSVSMAGGTAVLLEQVKLSGVDGASGTSVESYAPALDTTLSGDEGVQDGDGIVALPLTNP